MPAPGTTLRYGKRYNPLTKDLYRDFVKTTGQELSFQRFKDIVWTVNGLIGEAVVSEEAGVELPAQLGHLVVTKYKSNKKPVDWVNSKRLGKIVPLLNLHSFGYVYHIKWFRMGCRFQNRNLYIFHPFRDMARSVAREVKGGKKYFKWENSDFWSTTKMERSFSKFFKKADDK